ncbi:unnamed protein product [Linum trigynum]|uniref:Uncharacterized protein n=1 Tax=Linum trigynum TaxID=586398 RepID=A0AAV2EZL0_9ROSI
MQTSAQTLYILLHPSPSSATSASRQIGGIEAGETFFLLPQQQQLVGGLGIAVGRRARGMTMAAESGQWDSFFFSAMTAGWRSGECEWRRGLTETQYRGINVNLI